MTLKVYISTTNDPQGQAYMEAAKQALWRINDLPLAPITSDEFLTDPAVEAPVETIKRVINDADLFIGVYGNEYGPMPPGFEVSHVELEYQYAHERGMQCLIFAPATPDYSALSEKTRLQLEQFKRHLAEHHVIHTFDTLDNLQAKVILAMGNYRKTMAQDSDLKPPMQRFRSYSLETAQTQDLETLVKNVLGIAQDDLQTLIMRAMELHDAQQAVQEAPVSPNGAVLVKPIFGTPSNRSQFKADIFMIMPFREEYNAVYENVIKPVTAGLNLTIKRGDDFSSTAGAIMQEVWAAINSCRLVIVETSVDNPNVYYELGIAHTLGKPAILITQAKEVEELPFDLRHRRFIHYENTIPGGETLEAELRRSILWILNDLKESEASAET